MSSLRIPSTTRRSTHAGRVGLATAAVLVTVPLAAGCGAGFNAATQSVKPNAAAGTVGGIKVNNVWVVVDPKTGNAEVIGAVSETGGGATQLTSVQAGGVTAHVVKPTHPVTYPTFFVSDDTVTIADGGSVSFGQAGNPKLELADGSFTTGTLSDVTFTFSAGNTLTLTAQVQPNAGLFADYDPNASGSPSPSPSAPPTASPSISASSFASASASGPVSAVAVGKTTASPSGSASNH